MSMLRISEAFNIQGCAKSQSWLRRHHPATSGRTWRAASCSSRATAWRKNSTLPVGRVGSRLYNAMTMICSGFDLVLKGTENESLNMSNAHYRVMAETLRRYYSTSRDGGSTHRNPVDSSYRRRAIAGQEGQCLRSGQYTQNFGEETSLGATGPRRLV